MNKLDTDIRMRVVSCLVEGNSIRATVRNDHELALISCITTSAGFITPCG
jgi:hypothetical protein